MNTNLSTPVKTRTSPPEENQTALSLSGLSPDKNGHKEQRLLTEPAARQAAQLKHWLKPSEDCHSDFVTLLMQTLARLANCPAAEVKGELEASFRRVCEFLEIDRAALWRYCREGAHSFRLSHVYPCGTGHSRRLEDELHQGERAERLTQSGMRRWPFEIDAEARTCFPWLSARVERGETLIFSSLTELPPEAVTDRENLNRLSACSNAMIPLLARGDVVGAASFTNREDRPWPVELVEQLKSLTQVLATGVARQVREDELQAALEESRRLRERLQAEGDYLKPDIKIGHPHSEIIGRSHGIRKVLHQAEQVATADCAVLLEGETGTGKELIAQEIHRLGSRRERRMVLVNCAALPSALVESELFGRERGAYTGALNSQVGRFEMADGATIFLDEVGELSLEVQAKLLRVLQDGEFQRLGSPKTHKVNVRVIAATNRDVAAEVRKGGFREDLYYRLRVFPITIPPLRERTEDIPLLVFAFMEEFSSRMGKKLSKVPRKSIEALERHNWPGNVRELRNVIEHSVILSSGDTLKLSAFADAPTREARPVTLAEAEREHILKTLESTGWRIKGTHGAAVRLDMQPSTLYSRMQKLGIPHRRRKDELAAIGI